MKTKYKLIAALLMLVVFGLGVAAGVLGERYVVHKKTGGPRPDGPIRRHPKTGPRSSG